MPLHTPIACVGVIDLCKETLALGLVEENNVWIGVLAIAYSSLTTPENISPFMGKLEGRRYAKKMKEKNISNPGRKGLLPKPGTVHNMIPRIWEFYPKWSGHDL